MRTASSAYQRKLSGVRRLGLGVGKGLAVLAHHQQGDVLDPFGHHLEGGTEDLGALARRHRSQFRQGSIGRVDGRGGVRGSGVSDRADGRPVSRVGDIEPITPGRGDPFPTYQQIRGHGTGQASKRLGGHRSASQTPSRQTT